MIAKMKDSNNHITIPEFYDNVLELSDEEKKDISLWFPFSLSEYKCLWTFLMYMAKKDFQQWKELEFDQL